MQQQVQSYPQRPRRRRQRRRLSLRKVLRLLLPVGLAVFLCVVMCTPTERVDSAGSAAPVAVAESAEAEQQPAAATVAESKAVTTTVAAKRAETRRRKVKSVDELEEVDTVGCFLACLDEMPEPTRKIKVNYFGDMRRFFNDSNYIHLAEAEGFGIKPLTDTRSHWKLRSRLVKVTSCEDFYIDSLVYSRPYLVPTAAGRLHEIGRRFRDSIEARGGGDYRIKVTSLLRTPRTVKMLRRRNRNAIDSSVHQYGTTFDISYANFIADNADNPRSVDDLKGILGEVLKAMREEGKLWVKYERGQPCFHITARKKQANED